MGTLTPKHGRSSSSSGHSRERPVKRAFYVWTFFATSLFVVVHQFSQTAKVARLTKHRDPSQAFLPEWSLMAANDYLNAWWHNDENENDDDEELDDDNVFDSDDDDDDDAAASDGESNHQEGEGGEEEEEDTKEGIDAELKGIRMEMDQYAKANGGKLNPKLMLKYQDALRRRRGLNRKKRLNLDASMSQEKQYYDKALNSAIEYINKRAGNDTTTKDGVYDLEAKRQRAAEEREARKRRAEERRKRRQEMIGAGLAWKPPGFNTTDFSNYPIRPEERILPDMSEEGGIIFFLHVPKTGGQTIRQMNPRFRRKLEREANKKLYKNFQRLEKEGAVADARIDAPILELSPQAKEFERLCQSKVRFVIANTLDVFLKTAVPQVNMMLKHSQNKTSNLPDQNKILLIEVHGTDNYHALELEPYLHYWREEAKKAGVPFFSFTLVREALSLQISFFNYYYIHPGDPRFCKNPVKPQQKCGQSKKDKMMEMRRRWGGGNGRPHRFDPRGMDLFKNKKTHENGMTDMSHKELETAMMKVAYDNPQCLFLARGERTYGDWPDVTDQRKNLKRNECQEMYESLQRTMDWIGRTDTLTTETLPLLANVMFKRPELGPHLPKANVSPQDGGWLKLSKTSQAAVKALKKKSDLDQELYHRAMQDYTMDQWDRASPAQ